MRFIKTDSKEFNRQLGFSTRLEFFTVYPKKTLDGWDLYVATGGGCGFALTPDNEIVNLFNNTGTKLCGREALDFAISKGGRKVFCFDGFLRKYYERAGFRVVCMDVWLPAEAPRNWNYKEYGRPGVVWLELPAGFYR